MDDELRHAFATISGQLSSVSSEVHASTALLRETIVEVRHLGVRVEKLERHAFGSDPPPKTPISRQLSTHDGDIATLAGNVIAVNAKVEALTKMQAEQTAMLTSITRSVGGFLGHPMTRRVAALVGAIIIAWLSAKAGFR